MLERAAFVAPATPEWRRVRYRWDDTRASRDFSTDAAWVVERANLLCLRARMVLCVGLYEWVVWRFEGLHDDPAPYEVLEAAWHGTMDPRNLAFFELSRGDWIGPVRGPLWCAITWLRPALAVGDHQPGEVADALQYLTRLAAHVLPNAAPFQAWLDSTLTRFKQLFPQLPDDPFDDLFDRHIGRRRGPPISRDALDPAHPYTEQAAAEWAQGMRAALQIRPTMPYIARP